MSYTVLARRYRSQRFDAVVGQQTVARTLINAIHTGRVAHAYLFSGTRGVGKTSMARLFARALNAPDTVEDAPKPDDAEYPEPEVQQRMAEAVMRGDDLNVIEIDGASNRGVDDARDLIAKAGLSPTANARYKVYIIDEVHMLTREAFNALLKLMEEPPAHVKFILCTTEPHKVPATIQSRCQRFDFRNIPTAQIAEHLGNVLKSEAVTADEEVLWQIARLGNGSMRDALSLMDRLLATGENPITAQVLEDMLGLPDHALVHALVEALADGDLKATLEKTADLLARGIGQDQLIEVLIERLRQLMLISACGADSELIELSEDANEKAAAQAKRFDALGLVHMIALLENLQRHAKSSPTPRALLDATVVRLALAEKMADVTALLAGAASTSAPASANEKKNAELTPAAAAPSATATSPAPSRGCKPAGPQATEVSGFPGSAGPTPQSSADASPTPAPTPVALDPADPPAVWTALLKLASHTNAAAWLDLFTLEALDAGTQPMHAVIAPRPNAQHARRFATAPRLERLGVRLAELLHAPVRVTVADAPARRTPDEVSQSSDAPNAPGKPGIDRRAVLGLPLVRDALEVFPDAILMDARPEKTDDASA